MKIIEVNKLEDCFDGSSTYCYAFDEAWTRDDIQHLLEFGPVDYFPDFPRPYFRLRGDGGWQLKGIEGEESCLAVFPRKRKEQCKKEFEERFDTSA